MNNSYPQMNSSGYEYFLLVAEISAALWVHIIAFETTLRNFIHDSLSNTYGSSKWWLKENLLTTKDIKDILRVQKRSRVLDLLLNARLVGSGGGI